MSENESVKSSEEQKGYFRFSDAGKAFQKKIDPTNGAGIRIYWLCAQLGLIAYDKDKSLPTPPGQGNELTDNFVDKTRHHQVLIRSFLMYRYLGSNSFGIDDLDEEEAEEIESLMDTFLQTTGSHLKNSGMKELDKYAQKGWDILESKKLNNIQDLSVFLEQYVDLILSYSV